jgi:hypothetical protein
MPINEIICDHIVELLIHEKVNFNIDKEILKNIIMIYTKCTEVEYHTTVNELLKTDFLRQTPYKLYLNPTKTWFNTSGSGSYVTTEDKNLHNISLDLIKDLYAKIKELEFKIDTLENSN